MVKSCIGKLKNPISWWWCLYIYITDPKHGRNNLVVEAAETSENQKKKLQLPEYTKVNRQRITLIFIIYYWWLKPATKWKKKQESADFAFGKSFNTASSLGFDDGGEETTWEMNILISSLMRVWWFRKPLVLFWIFECIQRVWY